MGQPDEQQACRKHCKGMIAADVEKALNRQGDR
jgi:hypothetical protein